MVKHTFFICFSGCSTFCSHSRQYVRIGLRFIIHHKKKSECNSIYEIFDEIETMGHLRVQRKGKKKNNDTAFQQ